MQIFYDMENQALIFAFDLEAFRRACFNRNLTAFSCASIYVHCCMNLSHRHNYSEPHCNYRLLCNSRMADEAQDPAPTAAEQPSIEQNNVSEDSEEGFGKDWQSLFVIT